MHEPPSEQLVRQLTELQLCRLRDLQHARGRVRRLSFDLPAFDSVWIDSLVQLRLLTPYQAKQLEQGNGDGLRIGSFVAIDELGRSIRNSTYLARRFNRRDRCVVKRYAVSGEKLDDTRRQLTRLLELLGGFVHPQLVVPHEIVPSDEDELVVVSRFVPGLPLNELLVRRGRFPATVVLEIGRQLFEGLAALHGKSLVHGDIRLTNIRLTDSGLAVLVNGAIRPVVHPYITLHDDLSLDTLNVLAPELLGTGVTPTARSEMYAVGCILWQLLTGRPPFVSADPLVKIAAHQTQTIEDVRAWAPDTPTMLADSIRQLTSPAPDARPRSFDEVLQNWGRSGSFGRSRLRQFRRLFNGSVPHFSRGSEPSRSSNWIWTAATMVFLAGAVALFSDHGLRTELLSVGPNVKKFFQTSPVRSDQPKEPTVASENSRADKRDRGLLPLPVPSSDGVVYLTEPGPYDASRIAFDGRLTIRSAPEVSAEIAVGKAPLNLSAAEVCLERVNVRRLIADPLIATVTVRSAILKLINCEFLGFDFEETTDHSFQSDSGIQKLTAPAAAVAWRRFANENSKPGAISIQNCVFHGNGVSLLLAQTPESVRVENSLKTGSEAFMVLGPKTAATTLALNLERLTLRKSGALLQIGGEFASTTGAATIRVKAADCVFQLKDTNASLIRIDADQLRDDVDKSIEMTALESVVEPGILLLAEFDPVKHQLVELNGDEQFQGLIASEINFVGSRLHRSADAQIASIHGPRNSEANLPGIDPTHLGTKSSR